MASIISHNIISPLGSSSIENFTAILEEKSAIVIHPGLHNSTRPYSASLFTNFVYDDLRIDGYSKFESLLIQSISKSLHNLTLDVTSKHTCLILSTTKADIEGLEDGLNTSPGIVAQRIADYFGITTTPIVVCNACISGVSAMLLAQRLIDANEYNHIIVCGCDMQSEFIISGFQALNAVSQKPCLPFDIERTGLSLGEAVATVIMSKETEFQKDLWQILIGQVRNDAYHNTTPSPNGNGCCDALKSISSIESDVAVINAHGTATMFNDQMESKAIENAGLSHIPVNGLKGYFGHTMGAAGIVETIITMMSLDAGIIIGTKGFNSKGVSGKINIVPTSIPTDKKSFIKIISGFGGCNGALLLSKEKTNNTPKIVNKKLKAIHSVRITSSECFINDKAIETTAKGKALLKELYTTFIGNYPKFHKMDLLCQLGFIAVEILLSSFDGEVSYNSPLIMFNKSSSVVTDKQYLQTIADKSNYFPSPALFVYTLPNIVLSEIAIKNQINGETTFYVMSQKDESVIAQIQKATLNNNHSSEMISGWIDCFDENNFSAEISIII